MTGHNIWFKRSDIGNYPSLSAAMMECSVSPVWALSQNEAKPENNAKFMLLATTTTTPER